MTVALSGKDIAGRISEKIPGAVIEAGADSVLLDGDSLLPVMSLLKNEPDFGFDYLNYITAVDCFDYFEVVYQLTSMERNHSLVVKARCHDRENPALPSVVELWQGADFQEREVYDLMGIRFEGHPNMKRIFLWDGFQGHPLRKDYY